MSDINEGLAFLHATVISNEWIPRDVRDKLSLKQAEFLMYTGKEALYGGAAGGGKSYSLLMAALQYVDQPGYHALILRRTYKQLSKADSIMFTAREWLEGTRVKGKRARWNSETHMWTFPSGATIEFGHMEHESNKYDYKSAAWQLCCFDELTEFTESMYLYLFSRLRRPQGSTLPIRMRAASNPGGPSHEAVKARFVDEETRHPDAAFFPASLYDNPNIDQKAYEDSLSNLGELERAQLLRGDWNAIEAGRFERAWFGRYDIAHAGMGQGGEFYLSLDGHGKPIPPSSVCCSCFGVWRSRVRSG